MSDKTHIEWTDATWNPITGCSIVSPGCTHCYAMKLAGTRLKHHHSRVGLTKMVNESHVWTGEVRLNKQWLSQPLSWRKPRMIFVCAHGDLFHENVPDQWIDSVFAVMTQSPQHIFQVLTKRPERMLDYITNFDPDVCDSDGISSLDRLVIKGAQTWPLPNVWLGVSVENQETAVERIYPLMQTPAALRFLSVEPLLSCVDLDCLEGDVGGYTAFQDVNWSEFVRDYKEGCANSDWEEQFFGDFWATPEEFQSQRNLNSINWVICGGESGTRPRQFDPNWARSIRDQCAEHDVPFFMKQMSGHTKAERQAIPDDLMVREWPINKIPEAIE